jgi:hypothetical protein
MGKFDSVVDQVQRDGIVHLGRLAVDPGQDLRRPEVLEPVGHDAQRLAPALREAAGEHVRRVAGVTDDLLDALVGLGRDVRSIVQDAGDGLRRDACGGRDILDRQAGPGSHDPLAFRQKPS